MKKNKGITLIALVVTIVVLLIIASVSTYSGISSLRNATENKQISELNMMKQAAVENYTKYLLTEKDMYLRGEAISYSEMETLISEINSKKSSTEETVTLKVEDYGTVASDAINPGYYYRLSSDDLEEMSISEVEDTYIVNYATGEVINETELVTESGVPLYTYSTDYEIE